MIQNLALQCIKGNSAALTLTFRDGLGNPLNAPATVVWEIPSLGTPITGTVVANVVTFSLSAVVTEALEGIQSTEIRFNAGTPLTVATIELHAKDLESAGVFPQGTANGQIRDVNQVFWDVTLAPFGGLSISTEATAIIQTVPGPGFTDGDKGDIVISGGATILTIDAGVVNTTKMGGDVTTAGKALLDDADAAAQRTTLGLGTIATQNADAVAITGGTIQNTYGLYSQLLNEAVIHEVYNNSGVTIAKGEAVYITGSQGTRLTIAKANASSEATAATTFGVALQAIGLNSSGYVANVGIISGLNTNTLTEGATIWLATADGQLTTTRPIAPNHGVAIGFCVKQGSGSSGIIYVKINNGQELEELHDVYISGVADDQMLRWNAGRWENFTPDFAPSVHTHASTDITDLTSSARTFTAEQVFKAASATAASLVAISFGNTAAQPTGIANTAAHFIGGQGADVHTLLDSAGGINVLQFRRCNGTYAAQTAIANNDVLGSFRFQGYGVSTFATSGEIRAVANQAFTETARGTNLEFYVTPPNSITSSLGLRLSSGTLLTGHNAEFFGSLFLKNATNINFESVAGVSESVLGVSNANNVGITSPTASGSIILTNRATNGQIQLISGTSTGQITMAAGGSTRLTIASTGAITATNGITSTGLSATSGAIIVRGFGTISSVPAGYGSSNIVGHFIAPESATFPYTLFDATGNTLGHILAFRNSRGTYTTRTATQNGDLLGTLSFGGHNATSLADGKARINAYATETWTGTNNGAGLQFFATPAGSTTAALAFSIVNPTYASFGGQIVATDLQLSNSAGTTRNLFLRTAGVTRWTLGATATAETGLNVGSDFQLDSFTDAGGYNFTALTISRSGGNATFYNLVTAPQLRVSLSNPPASATATGTAGMIRWDADYIYVCTATNTWKRVTIATWP